MCIKLPHQWGRGSPSLRMMVLRILHGLCRACNGIFELMDEK